MGALPFPSRLLLLPRQDTLTLGTFLERNPLMVSLASLPRFSFEVTASFHLLPRI